MISLKTLKQKQLPVNFYGNCDPVDNYEKVATIGEGTYGIVYQAKHKETGKIYALKRVRMEQENDGLPISSLREISLLKSCDHENIVQVFDVAVGSNLAMEYCDVDLAHVMDNYISKNLKLNAFSPGEVKCLMEQLLQGVLYLHKHYIIHRDLKLSNLLLNGSGTLKIADFGLARKKSTRIMTPGVVTIWYRAPELLFGAEDYDGAIDMWAVGCIFGEFLTSKPLLPGKTEVQQIGLISKLLGAPSSRIWPSFEQLPFSHLLSPHATRHSNVRETFKGCSSQTIHLLESLLTYDPFKRIRVFETLHHRYFDELPSPSSRKSLAKYIR